MLVCRACVHQCLESLKGAMLNLEFVEKEGKRGQEGRGEEEQSREAQIDQRKRGLNDTSENIESTLKEAMAHQSNATAGMTDAGASIETLSLSLSESRDGAFEPYDSMNASTLVKQNKND